MIKRKKDEQTIAPSVGFSSLLPDQLIGPKMGYRSCSFIPVASEPTGLKSCWQSNQVARVSASPPRPKPRTRPRARYQPAAAIVRENNVKKKGISGQLGCLFSFPNICPHMDVNRKKSAAQKEERTGRESFAFFAFSQHSERAPPPFPFLSPCPSL